MHRNADNTEWKGECPYEIIEDEYAYEKEIGKTIPK